MSIKNWEDEFDESDYDDHKSAYIERERLRQENSVEWWIYIGVDIERLHLSKIGLTSGSLGTRATGTQNTFYTLYFAFKVKHGIGRAKLKEIEDAIIAMLELRYERLSHRTGRKSEWFVISADEMREEIYYFLCQTRYIYDMKGYFCQDRDMWVIETWQNLNLLEGKAMPPYRAKDHSNPPVAFECLMPPGCGALDCTCWD